MKTAILHISDLHLTEFNPGNGRIPSRTISKQYYIEQFIHDTKEKLHDWDAELKKVVVTGDLANEGSRDDYEIVFKELTKLKEGFNLESQDFIIVPGNHDIHRGKNSSVHQDSDAVPKPEPNQFHDAKFQYFIKFYNDFFGNDFEPCKPSIIPFEFDDKKIAFVCLNSNYKESCMSKDHYGYLNLEDILKIESALLGEFKDYYKVAVVHHNPNLDSAEKSIKNWDEVKGSLNSMGIFSFLCGHVHTSENLEVKTTETNCFCSVGSFAKEDPEISNTSALLVYEKEESGVLFFKLERLRYICDGNGLYGKGAWDIDTTKYNKDIKIGKHGVKVKQCVPIISARRPTDILPETTGVEQAFLVEERNEQRIYSDEILSMVREKNAVLSGHFHWSDTSRSHGWIDTGSLLIEDRDIEIIGKAIFSVIKTKEVQFDGIVGLGMEGNILGALVAAATNKPYTYIPVPYRKAYNEYELYAKVNSKRILLLADVISTASTITNIISNTDYRFLSEAEELRVITLFFTGDEKRLKELYEKFENLRIYAICNEIKFGHCGKEPEECPIVKHKLEQIHEFYTKE
ncbi:metallophosphoesterase [Pelosinus sp. UFO1]|uniref:metallophosphoesterase n=1 Tax=Pelosinus sp. UFO1 TaxID=484770 RepID=UPI0004D0BE34|nr:metallophosphoesterase [Pelosinus sp. UFO1]AIF53523.1 Calcineurin-like phosphoesterase superfamily domain containing protein [Pelosinus sp. UFO1]